MTHQPPFPMHAQPVASSEPSQEDRLLAACAYLGQLVGFWLIAPIVVYALKRDKSRFAAVNAMQAIVLHLVLVPVMAVSVVLAFGSMFLLFPAFDGHRAPSQSEAQQLGLFMVLVQVGAFAVPGVIHLLFCIIGAVRAGQGKVAGIPVTRWIAEKIVNADKGVPRA